MARLVGVIAVCSLVCLVSLRYVYSIAPPELTQLLNAVLAKLPAGYSDAISDWVLGIKPNGVSK
jgi:hypothetical protein